MRGPALSCGRHGFLHAHVSLFFTLSAFRMGERRVKDAPRIRSGPVYFPAPSLPDILHVQITVGRMFTMNTPTRMMISAG